MALVCGTGLGNFPQVGDPDLDSSILTCFVGNIGIYVNWTYPPTLTEAVSHIQIYRNTVNDENIEIKKGGFN